MSEINNKQKGDNNTQIGEQTNIESLTVVNTGLSATEATKIAIDLFHENFPKLQQEAQKIIESRIEEFCNETVKKIVAKKGNDFSAFADPDMQYCLIEAQKDYARFGTTELRNSLANLIATRAIYDKDFKVKVVIDKAIQVAKYLTENELDLLSIIFYAKHVKFEYIDKSENKLELLKERLDVFSQFFSNADKGDFGILSNFDCLQMLLGHSWEVLAKTYNMNKEEVKSICPKLFLNVPADYGLSYVGRVIAIMNVENKTGQTLSLETWLK